MRWFRVKFIVGRETEKYGVVWSDTERTVDLRANSSSDAMQQWRDAIDKIENETGYPSNIYVYDSEEIG